MSEIGLKAAAAELEALRARLDAAALAAYFDTPNGTTTIIVHPFGAWIVADGEPIPISVDA